MLLWMEMRVTGFEGEKGWGMFFDVRTFTVYVLVVGGIIGV